MKLSVCIVTYNHEKYIEECIDSVLMQKTDFDFEILIGEDDSSDNTREICKKYAEKYPQIRLFLNDRKNVIYINGHPTGRWNMLNLLKNATGKYIAILDGDDYWADPYKLQKQVDILEEHPEFSVCFHRAKILFEDGSFKISNPKNQKKISTIEDIFDKKTYILTSTKMFRNYPINDLPQWFYNSWSGDVPLNIYHASKGQIYFIDDVMSVYRKHSNGLTGDIAKNIETKIYRKYNRIELLYSVNKYYNYKYSKIINKVIIGNYSKLVNIYIDKKNWRNIIKLLRMGLFNSEHRISFNLFLTMRIIFLISKKIIIKDTSQ